MSQAPLLPGLEALVSDDRNHLVGSSCTRCGAARFPQGAVCPSCQSREIEPSALPTTGEVYTYSIIHAPPPGYLGDVPYVVGIVELPNGLRVTTTLLADDLDDVRVGATAEFETVELGEGDERRTSFAYRIR